MQIYTNIIKLKSLFVCLFERANLRNCWFEFRKVSENLVRSLFALDSPFIEEGYSLYNITLWPIAAEQGVKPRGTAGKNIKYLKMYYFATKKKKRRQTTN